MWKLWNDRRRQRLTIFDRLAPLLLLRRTPSFLLRRLWEDETAFPYLSRLTNALAERMDSGVWSRDTVTPEERRLAAAIAGHALPYSTSSEKAGLSCFQQLCVPAFRMLLEASSNGCGKTALVGAIHRAKAALYAACHHLALAQGCVCARHQNEATRPSEHSWR